jgi:hypothetical protein
MAKLVLTRHIYGERFSQRIAPNARTFVNVVQHLPDFGHFEMNKRDLGRQREDPILVAEEPATNNYLASCKSPGSFSIGEFKTPLRKFVKTFNKHFEQLL